MTEQWPHQTQDAYNLALYWLHDCNADPWRIVKSLETGLDLTLKNGFMVDKKKNPFTRSWCTSEDM